MAWSFRALGSFDNTRRFLKAMKKGDIFKALEPYAQEGVNELQAFTPKDSGVTATSWSYQIIDEGDRFSIQWTNSNTNQGYNIAVLIQHGHGTGTGGYVVGQDYINPALKPIFDKIADKAWKAVTSA